MSERESLQRERGATRAVRSADTPAGPAEERTQRGSGTSRRMRVVVCGTRFGQVYLEALQLPGLPFELAGVLARGSDRSRACAEHYGVPLFTGVDRLPDGIDIACVVVRGGLVGGPGSELATALMARGIHVLQEHPLHHDELADCLKQARRYGVAYRLNSFYLHQEPVRRFVAAARELLRRQRCRYVDASCGFQVAYSMLDILGVVLGTVRPWTVGEASAPPAAPGETVPFRTVQARLAGVPATLRIQHQIDPARPDRQAHLLHRVTVGTDGGSLTLVSTHGPTVWCPRPDFPARIERTGTGWAEFAPASLAAPPVEPRDHFDIPGTTVLGPRDTPSYRGAYASVWPRGVAHALLLLRQSIVDGELPMRAGAYHLMLCRLWQEIAARLGPPDPVDAGGLGSLTPADVSALAAAGEDAVAGR
jgi:pyochelin biosynthesis protein PchG